MYRLTIRIRSDDTIHPNTNTLFRPSEYEANIRYIPSFNSFDRTKWDK